MKPKNLFIILGAAVLIAAELHAQSSDSGQRSGTFSSSLNGGYTSAGNLELRGVESGGEMKTSSFQWNGSYEKPLGDRWSFQIGAEYEHLKLDYDQATSPLPETLSSLSLELGARWRYNDRWVFSASIAPGIYGDSEIDSSDAFTVPVTLAATWIKSEDLAITFGVRVRPFSDNELMPIVNVRWAINPEWNLVFGLPRTEVRYRLNERLTLFAGVGAFGGSYAVDDPAVIAPPGVSPRDTKLSVSEFRALIGIDYEIAPNIELRLEGGYGFSREFDYHERDLKYEAEAAPSLGLSLNVSF